MLGYLFKRILLFVPTLVVISVLAFFLSKNAPGDPVERFFEDNYSAEDYQRKAESLNLDKPLFYWSILPSVLPDTFCRIVQPYKKEVIRSLSLKTGSYESAILYYDNLESAIRSLEESYSQAKSDSLLAAINTLKSLLAEENQKVISTKSELIPTGEATAKFLSAVDDLKKTSSLASSGFAPATFHWNGSDNQYHLWISKFLSGNFGYSLVSGKDISTRVKSALSWTLLLNITAILLAFFLSIPIGVYAARHANQKQGKIVTLVTYLLYSLPVFWVATMLLVFFTTPEYGMDWFAGVGLGKETGHSSFFDLMTDRITHLFLPVFCLVYPSLAFISRQLSGAMQDELKKDYITTARAKGLPEKKVIWKHAFRNSLFPLITVFASILPATIAGSVVIEVIFNIPGMGKLMVDSIFLQDWPVVFIILLLGAILTMTGILLADLLYAKFDPRVRLN
jgi:peptide/nickel transport system permease protein